MKLKQIVYKEIPITVKLMIFMWILRKFVSIGAKFFLRVCMFIYERYINAKELRFIGGNQIINEQINVNRRL
jgi:hypothetical protein